MPLLTLFSGYMFQFCYILLIFFFLKYQAELSFILWDWIIIEIPCRGHAAMALYLRWKRDESRLSAILLTAVLSLNETPSNCCFFPSFNSSMNSSKRHFPPDGGCLLSFCEWFLQTCVPLPSIKYSSSHSSMCSGWEFLWLIRIVLRAKQTRKWSCLIFPEMGIQSVSPLVPLQMYFPLSCEREIFSDFSSGFDLKIQPFMPNEIPISFNAGNFRWTLTIFHVPCTNEVTGTAFWK